jgi:hypothetical protein
VRQHDLGEVVVILRVEMAVMSQITQAVSSNQGAYWILVVMYRSGMMRGTWWVGLGLGVKHLDFRYLVNYISFRFMVNTRQPDRVP